MNIVNNLTIERDHIGLYPRTGDADKAHQIPLLYILTIPEGRGTLDISADHPLTAPIKKQLKDGSPGGSWRYIAAKKDDAHFIFGALTVSAGNRLLFFPSNYNVHVDIENSIKYLDHISLESKTRLHSHYTFRDGTHLSNGTIRDMGNSFSLWFSIFIGNLDNYIRLPNEIKVSIDWPASDIMRFSKEGVLANYNTKSIIEIPSIVDGKVLHQIDFILASSDEDIADLPNVILENVHSLNQPKPTMSGIAKIEVLQDYSLFVRITERAGQLAGDTLIMSTDLE